MGSQGYQVMTRLAQGSVGLRARLGLVLASAIIPAVLSYGAPAVPGTDASGRVVRFSFSQSALSKPVFDIPAPDHESFPFVICQWPDGKTSISISASRQAKCYPQGTRFPVTKGGSWALLDSPIGGALYPIQNGHLSDDIRFVHASGAPGVMSVGPVLMQFGDYSGGARPSFIVSGNQFGFATTGLENVLPRSGVAIYVDGADPATHGLRLGDSRARKPSKPVRLLDGPGRQQLLSKGCDPRSLVRAHRRGTWCPGATHGRLRVWDHHRG